MSYVRIIMPAFLVLVVSVVANSMANADSPEGSSPPADDPPAVAVSTAGIADLPDTLTSFGGAIAGQTLYVYGGHTAEAHSYSVEEQSNRFFGLNLGDPNANWVELASGPRIQGLALVPDGDGVVRIGGFSALNEEGEDHDLHSQNDVERFDSGDNTWVKLPPLPEPRSSHDAAVLGRHVYVVGGWNLDGDQPTHWHETAWTLDLDDIAAGWKPIANPPQSRRALSVAAHDGQLYAIGGMKKEGGTTTDVEIYDPVKDRWTAGPKLPGEPMNGFGNSAFATGGRLFVTTVNGDILMLNESGDDWVRAGTVEPARFFHRMLPDSDHSLLMVGGANMEEGKYVEIQRIKVD